MNNIKKGFSLVELLISLIVISCITAAFTPLITKKFATNIGFGGGGGGGNGDSGPIATKCDDKFTAECLLCNDTICLSCAKTCPDGLCQDADNCVCKECPASEFPNCAKFTSTGCIQCQKGYRLGDNQCAACPDGRYSDNGLECKYCEPGFWPSADKTSCEPCPEGYICNDGVQIKCSGTTAPTIEDGQHICAPCPVGSYCKDGVGKKCSEQWEGCLECDSNACTKCGEGTILSDGKCATSLEDLLQIDTIYVTKFNMGDKTIFPIPSNVTILTPGKTSDICLTGRCCWKGVTADSRYCDSSNGGYNGCNRTVCTLEAAREICAQFDLNNESWRLPTNAEVSAWNAHSLGKGSAGLQLCSNTTSTSNDYAKCYNIGYCYGAYNSYCNPNYVWSSETKSQGYYITSFIHSLDYTNWNNKNEYRGHAGSVRCVATISGCPKGQYKNGTSCASCESKFPHCAACDSSKCHTCTTGYTINPYNDKCYKEIEDAYPVGNLYVTKLNMGDGGIPIPASVTVIDNNTGSNCTSEKCCWQGPTSDSCQDTTGTRAGGYSGCKRTVCNWYAANEICAKYDAGGKTWRLPSNNELSSWNLYSVGSGTAGIQLCDYGNNSNYYSTYCYLSGSRCKGAVANQCLPAYVWAQTATTTSAYNSYLSGNYIANNYHSGKNYAMTVRCVTNLDYD